MRTLRPGRIGYLAGTSTLLSALILQILLPSMAFATPANGSVIVYDDEKISSLTADGSSSTTLYAFETNPSDANATHVQDISSNGKQVVFDKNDHQELFVANVFGDNAKIIATVSGSGDRLGTAQFSSDGTQIVYIKKVSNEIDLELYNLVTGVNTQLVSLSSGGPSFLNPSFSSDGTKVLFGEENSQQTAISLLIVPATGGSPTTVVNDGKFDIPLTLSPDGSKIVYGQAGISTSSAATAAELHVVGVDGSNNTVLDTVTAPECTDPTQESPCSIQPNYYHAIYSPDGTKIAYQIENSFANTNTGDSQQPAPIKMVNAVGGGITTLDAGTFPNGTQQLKAFSPDGTRVLYHKVDSGLSGTPVVPYSITTSGSGAIAYAPASIPASSNVSAEVWLPAGPTFTQGPNGTILTDIPDGTDYSTESYTVVDKEVLTVDGNLGNAIVESGGTLNGTGTIGSVSVESGGHIAPGHSPGCLTLSSVFLNSGSNYDAELGGTDACSGYDQLIANGAIDVTGANLNVSLYNGFTPKVGQTYTVINNTGSNPITGTFSGLAEGATFQASGYTFKISYVGGDGNDVILTVLSVPPAAPNTGLSALTTHPITTLAVTMATAMMIVFIARRLRPTER